MAEAFVNGGDFERALLPRVEEIVFARSGYVKLGEVASILIKHQVPGVFRIFEDIGVSKEVSRETSWWGLLVSREERSIKKRVHKFFFGTGLLECVISNNLYNLVVKSQKKRRRSVGRLRRLSLWLLSSPQQPRIENRK